MQFPFHNAIKSTASGTPGAGSFTPSAAAAGYFDWSTVPTGWWGLVRFEDGSAWELRYCYWNGTSITRPSNIVASSTGSALTLSSSATAEMVADAFELAPNLGRYPVALWTANANQVSALNGMGWSATTLGTGGSAAIATTNFLTEQPRQLFTSATTASAEAGLRTNGGQKIASSVAGHGGWEFSALFGASQLPTGPRAYIGMGGGTGSPIGANEPSALARAHAGFSKDSTDTNLQLIVNANTTPAAAKTNTSIPLAVNGWYYAKLWSLPGSLTVYALLVRLDTGDIFYTSTSSSVPANGSILGALCSISLNGTNTGTAALAHIGSVQVR